MITIINSTIRFDVKVLFRVHFAIADTKRKGIATNDIIIYTVKENSFCISGFEL